MYVFVYGTLTDPVRARAVLGRADSGTRAGTTEPSEWEFVGEATLEGLRRLDGEYPTLVPGGSVDGRLLAVDEAGLEALDAYEGVDRGLYVRVTIPSLDPSDGPQTGTEPEKATSVNSSGESDEVGTQNPEPESDVYTYVGDPERLDVETGRDSDPYWPESGTFRERVRRHLDRAEIVVTLTE